MIKTLAIKELRESAGLVALAALGMAWVVLRSMGYNLTSMLIWYPEEDTHIAFLNDGFYHWTSYVVGALAVLLGLKQSAWELQHGAYHFILYRPIPRRLLMLIKLVVGIVLIILLVALAILVYGTWAATPGNRAAPFAWSMTGDSWLLACALPIIYVGGFLSGIRPARWFGTRLLPLLSAMFYVTFVLTLADYWWVQIPLILIGYAAFLAAIGYCTRSRDY
jgi:hypothetical protein